MTAPIETKTVKERMQRGIVQGWNQRNPIGTPVRYWPGVIKGPGVESVTRSEAWVMPSGHAVAMVEGYAGGIALTHIVPRGEAAPKRIQRKRTRGWRMPEGAVAVSRPGRWGNPFRVISPQRVQDQWGNEWPAATGEARGVAVRLFREALVTGRLDFDPDDVEEELRGKDLACWCPLVDADGNRVPCHADILLRIAAGEVDQ